METERVGEQAVRLTAENVGGIEHTDVTFEPGVTILTGRNATNRTSLLQAIMGGLGSDDVSLKGDADSGRITLQVGDSEYTRTLERQAGEVVLRGESYCEDTQLADLFAFLLESNDARRTVALEDDLHDIIMEPVDDAAIQAEIRQLTSRREDIDDKIDERDSLAEKLPSLEQQRVDIENQLETKRERLEAKRETLEARSADASEAHAKESKLEAKMQELQECRSALDTTTFRLESQEESLASLNDQQATLQAEYEQLQTADGGTLDDIEADVSRLRDQKQRLESELSKLQNVIQFNEEMLDGTSQDIAAALRGDSTDEAVTDQLLDTDDSVVCWTCGSEVEQEAIEETLARLRELRQSKYTAQTELEDDLADLKERRSQLQETETRREQLEDKLAEIRAEIDERESKIDDLERERDDIEADIDQLEAEIEELEAQDRSDVLDAHREVNELELEVDRLEGERDRLASNIDDIQSQLSELADLDEQREALTEQLNDLRTRIDRIEQEAVEAFNTHMETVLDILDYENLNRIWVERAQTETRDGRRTVTQTEFRLHVVRSTEDGVTYEDDFTHLSESEREVTGLVFALAGYLAHDVHEEVPFILLDSLEAIDSERISALVDYMREYADYLVVALLEEDAAALDDSYARVTDI